MTLPRRHRAALASQHARHQHNHLLWALLGISVLAMVVVGGVGSTLGVTTGAIVLTLMPEVFRVINDYKLLVYGGLLLGVMMFSPQGLQRMVKRMIAARGHPQEGRP